MGIDTETRPNFVSGRKNPTGYLCKSRIRPDRSKSQFLLEPALLQISMRTESKDERVFIFDLLAILPQYSQELSDLLEPSWSSKRILKLGQGLNQDMRVRHVASISRFCYFNVPFIFRNHRSYLQRIR